MAKIFVNTLFQQIEPALNSREIKNAVLGQAEEILEIKKNDLLNEFNNDEVTKEIEGGPDASNISGTLDRGNLFSFIGFKKGSDPIRKIREILQNGINLQGTSSFNRRLRGYTVPVNIPPIENIYDVTPYPASDNMGGPWNPGSWVRGIEVYISGLEYYLFERRGLPKSRSGVALQIPHELRPSSRFERRDYLGTMLQKFRANVSRGPKGRFI